MANNRKKRTDTLLTALLVVLILSLITVVVCSCIRGAGPQQGSEVSSVTALSSEEASSVNSNETSSTVSTPPVDAPSSTLSEDPSSALDPGTSSPVSQPPSTSSGVTSGTPVDDPATRNERTQGTAEFPYYLAVNREQNMVIVYALDENGYYTVPYKAFVCSCGIPKENGTETTPAGTFNTTDQYTWRYLSGNVYGQYATRITGHILFHSVPYFHKDKATLEWEEYNKLGNDASLGCVRLSVIDAKWIYDNCPKGTTVTIYDSNRTEPFAKPTPIHIDEAAPERDWDPTDPDPANPWLSEEPEEPGVSSGDESSTEQMEE